jgi:hypothetical protein
MVVMMIRWVANPLRGDRFEEGWRPAAEAALDFGALSWSFLRSIDGRLDFIQQATFPSKAHFERYWYSERIAEVRTQLSGSYQVPLLPVFYEIVGEGATQELTVGEQAPA